MYREQGLFIFISVTTFPKTEQCTKQNLANTQQIFNYYLLNKKGDTLSMLSESS